MKNHGRDVKRAGMQNITGPAWDLSTEYTATDAPELLERILARSLEKERKDRWKSAATMHAALRPLVDHPG